jgi:hypothetical protein
MLYTPLKERDECRLIRLKPRDCLHGATLAQNGTLFCIVEHSFVALSYVWGDENDRRPIFVNGDLVHIGTNLEEALRELRHDTEDVVLCNCGQISSASMSIDTERHTIGT